MTFNLCSALTIDKVVVQNEASAPLLQQRVREFVDKLVAGAETKKDFSFDFLLDDASFLAFCVPGGDMAGYVPFNTAVTIHFFPKEDGDYVMLWLDADAQIKDYVIFSDPRLQLSDFNVSIGSIWEGKECIKVNVFNERDGIALFPSDELLSRACFRRSALEH